MHLPLTRRSTRPVPQSMGSAQNSLLLTALWRQHWSGTIQLIEGGTTRWITLSDGGPICGEDCHLLHRAMWSGGALVIQSGAMDGEGSRERMARLLMWCATRPQQPDFAVRNARRRVAIEPDALQLPLLPQTRALLQEVNGRARLSQLAVCAGVLLVPRHSGDDRSSSEELSFSARRLDEGMLEHPEEDRHRGGRKEPEGACQNHGVEVLEEVSGELAALYDLQLLSFVRTRLPR